MQLVLSLFPGIDLLGRAFEESGFCVVRGPDLIFGSKIETFNSVPGRFDGIIAGSPCPDFSQARRSAPTGDGLAMLSHFVRIVDQSRPSWFLLENVPNVPDLRISGYSVQRFNLRASECGARQSRLRCFQFGSLDGNVLDVPRSPRIRSVERCALAWEAKDPNRRSFADFCELQGLPRDFEIPGFSIVAKYRAVGNGVPLQMGRVLAVAIRDIAAAPKPRKVTHVTFCRCGCGRIVKGKQQTATATCRKRKERSKKRPRPVLANRDGIDLVAPGHVTFSLFEEKE